MPNEYTAVQVVQMRWPVLVTDSTPGMKKLALDRPVCVVGARSRVHLPLPSQLVSKSHAIIIQASDGVFLRDLASRNRTFVNDRAIRETRLRDSDVIRFGPFSFRCHSGFSGTADADQTVVGELRVESDRGAARVLPLSKQTFLIGSRYSCDLMITGDDISLAHTLVFERQGKRYVRDLNSLSGTLINGQAIREAELKAGDEIRIGGSRIMYNDFANSLVDPDTLPLAHEEGSGIPTGDLTLYADVTDISPSARPAGVSQPVPQPEPVQSESLVDNDVRLPWEKTEPMVFEMDQANREGE